jgi:hypothetical protein
MAAQMGMAYSATIKGVGVFAAGPYGCYNSSMGLKSCFNQTFINSKAINQTINSFSAQNLIDPLINLNTT